MNTEQRSTPTLDTLTMPQQTELPDGVIPFYGTAKAPERRPSRTKLGYDILMLLLLLVDLALILTDTILTSGIAHSLAQWLNLSAVLVNYQQNYHDSIATIGGFFTLFWLGELLVRWGLAIYARTYYRWFFFPFVHWYEVLGVIPALRILRLLRVVVIVRRLHRLGIQIVPQRWIQSAQFYYHVLLEELSDRVILTAIDNFRTQLHQPTGKHGQLLQQTIAANRSQIETAILELLRRELTPRLQAALLAEQGERLSASVGAAVEQALDDTPELRKYLKLIPIAGGMIESQIHSVGRSIGKQVTTAINQHLFADETLDGLMRAIAHGISQIDTTHPQVQTLVAEVVELSLSAFEEQIKIQQWKHRQQLP